MGHKNVTLFSYYETKRVAAHTGGKVTALDLLPGWLG